MTALQETNGCLTEAGLAAVEAEPVSSLPGALATHLASCARCQQRALRRGRLGPPGSKRPAPPLWRAVLLSAGLILVMLAAVALARWVIGAR